MIRGLKHEYKGETQVVLSVSLEETGLSRVDPVAVFSYQLMITEETELNSFQSRI